MSRKVEGGTSEPIHITSIDDDVVIPISTPVPIDVTATDLDIRDLSAIQDNVAISDGTDTLEIFSDGSVAIRNNGGPLDIQTHGEVDDGNSSITPLLANIAFVGTPVDILHVGVIFVNVYSDVPSDTDGLSIEQSPDGINWDNVDNYTIPATTGKTFSFQAGMKFFRVVYTNGGADQSEFRLQTVFKSTNSKPSSHRIQDSISTDDDAELIKAVITAQNPLGVFDNVEATTEGELKVSVVTPIGSLPVSQLTTLFDGKLLNRAMSEMIEVVGTGTETFADNKYNMSVIAGQYSIIRSRRCTPYFSGKPQKIECTFDKFAPEVDVVKRVGYFSSNIVGPYNSDLDGVWLESSNNTITIKSARNGTETISVDITDWFNFDKLGDYQDVSNWDNFTVIEFNFLWLGGAYLEMRMIVDTGFITAHSIIYAGKTQDTFTRTPNHPMRYEIRSTTGTGSFRYICNQIASVGSIAESWLAKSINSGVAPINFSSTGTTYPLLAIKKGTAFKDNPVIMVNADILITSNDTLRWSVQINPTLSAGLTYSAITNSAIESASGNGTITVVTPGIIIGSGYLTQDQFINPSIFAESFLSQLSGQIDGTQDEYVLCITPISSTLNALGAINYLEA